jgi:ribonuclease P protein component
MKKPYTLQRAVMLKQRRLFRALYDKADSAVGSIATGSIRTVYRVVPAIEGELQPFQVAFSPGRGIKGAVVRNRIKRLMREHFRLHQGLIHEITGTGICLHLILIYRAKPEEATQRICRDIPKILEQLAQKFQDTEISTFSRRL